MKKHIVLVVFLLILSRVPVVQAHKINLFAYEEGKRVYTEGYFSDGHPAQGEITVFDGNGRLLLKGDNNEMGLFDFIHPNPTTLLRIVLDASMGHRCTFSLAPSFRSNQEK